MDSVDNTNFISKSLTLLRTRLMGWFFWSQFFELAANRRIEMRWENRVRCLEWELQCHFQFSSWLFWLWASVCSEFWTKLSKLYCPSVIAFLVDCRQLFLHTPIVLHAMLWSSWNVEVLWLLCRTSWISQALQLWVVLTSHLPAVRFWEAVPQEQQARVLWTWLSKKAQLLNQVTVYKADLCQI